MPPFATNAVRLTPVTLRNLDLFYTEVKEIAEAEENTTFFEYLVSL